MNTTMIATEQATSHIDGKSSCLPLGSEQDSSNHSLATVVLHSFGQNRQKPRFRHGELTDRREADWFEDFDTEPEFKSVDEEIIMELTNSTLLEKVLFDLDGMLGIMPSNKNEDEVGDDIDEDSLYSDDDSIEVAKRRRERRSIPVEHKDALPSNECVTGQSSRILGCDDREQSCCNSSSP